MRRPPVFSLRERCDVLRRELAMNQLEEARTHLYHRQEQDRITYWGWIISAPNDESAKRIAAPVASGHWSEPVPERW